MKTKRFRTTPKAKGVTALPKSAVGRSYQGKLDSKKRLVIRGARHEYYEVSEQPNGSILLTPKKLVTDILISKRTLAMIDSSMKNLKKGKVFGPVDLTEFQKPKRSKISK